MKIAIAKKMRELGWSYKAIADFFSCDIATAHRWVNNPTRVPKYNTAHWTEVKRLLDLGKTPAAISKETGISRGTIYNWYIRPWQRFGKQAHEIRSRIGPSP